MSILKKVTYILGFLLLFIYLAGGYFFSTMLLKPKGSKIEQTTSRMLARSGFDYQKVYNASDEPLTFETIGANETPIRGWYFKQKDPNCGVVFSHGWTSNRSGALKFKYLFDECNCDMVFYDHRGHNASGGEYGTGGVLEREDLLAVTDWLQSQNGLNDSQIGLVGVSWGGATVLQAGGISGRQFSFILSDSPFQDWHTAVTERADRWYGSWTRIFTPAIFLFVKLRAGTNFLDASAIKYMANIQSPILLIHSQGDEETSSQQSVNLSKHLNAKSIFHHTQWGSRHAFDITHKSREYKELVDEFINLHVPSFQNCGVQLSDI